MYDFEQLQTLIAQIKELTDHPKFSSWTFVWNDSYSWNADIKEIETDAKTISTNFQTITVPRGYDANGYTDHKTQNLSISMNALIDKIIQLKDKHRSKIPLLHPPIDKIIVTSRKDLYEHAKACEAELEVAETTILAYKTDGEREHISPEKRIEEYDELLRLRKENMAFRDAFSKSEAKVDILQQLVEHSNRKSDRQLLFIGHIQQVTQTALSHDLRPADYATMLTQTFEKASALLAQRPESPQPKAQRSPPAAQSLPTQTKYAPNSATHFKKPPLLQESNNDSKLAVANNQKSKQVPKPATEKKQPPTKQVIKS